MEQVHLNSIQHVIKHHHANASSERDLAMELVPLDDPLTYLSEELVAHEEKVQASLQELLINEYEDEYKELNEVFFAVDAKIILL